MNCFQDIKSDSSQLKQSMDSLEEDSSEVRGSIKWVKEELRKMNYSLEKVKAKASNYKEDYAFNLNDFPYDDELYDGIKDLR